MHPARRRALSDSTLPADCKRLDYKMRSRIVGRAKEFIDISANFSLTGDSLRQDMETFGCKSLTNNDNFLHF